MSNIVHFRTVKKKNYKRHQFFGKRHVRFETPYLPLSHYDSCMGEGGWKRRGDYFFFNPLKICLSTWKPELHQINSYPLLLLSWSAGSITMFPFESAHLEETKQILNNSFMKEQCIVLSRCQPSFVSTVTKTNLRTSFHRVSRGEKRQPNKQTWKIFHFQSSKSLQYSNV